MRPRSFMVVATTVPRAVVPGKVAVKVVFVAGKVVGQASCPEVLEEWVDQVAPGLRVALECRVDRAGRVDLVAVGTVLEGWRGFCAAWMRTETG